MASTYAFAVPGSLAHLSPSLVKDVVFAHRNTQGQIDFAFAVGQMLTANSISSDEVVNKGPDGVSVGSGIYKIAGVLRLLANSGTALSQIQQHQGRRFEMAILYTDGVAEFMPNGANVGVPEFSPATLAQYPNAASFRDRLGVRFSVNTSRGGTARSWTLNVSGLTFGSTFRSVPSEAAFYSLFGANLNRWTADTSSII